VADLQVGALAFLRSFSMPDRRSINRTMFWRVLRRSVFANRGRLFVILLALGAGAGITAALLNLQIDAKLRINSDFSIFGPRALIAPKNGNTISEATLDQLTKGGVLSGARASLFLIATASVEGHSDKDASVVIAGDRGLQNTDAPHRIVAPSSETEPFRNGQGCIVGRHVADGLGAKVGDEILLKNESRQEPCRVIFIWASGDADDDRIRPPLGVAQRLAGLPGQVSVIELVLNGKTEEQDSLIERLQQRFRDLDVRPLRKFSQAQINIYKKISGILTATVAVVLLLTALCVMAAMTNVAMERKNDVGLMKAIGGSVRRVLRLFLAEAALLGLAGGLIGAAIGILISIGLGKAVFGVAAQPRLIVYPISVALTVIVAILAAYPLRRLVHIRPASVFRGEE
jgi:putative ABC transport system permease protein